MGHIAGCSLRRQPFAQVSRRAAGGGGQILDCDRACVPQGAVKAQFVADPHQRHAEGAAQIAQNAADQLAQSGVINLGHRFILRAAKGAA